MNKFYYYKQFYIHNNYLIVNTNENNLLMKQIEMKLNFFYLKNKQLNDLNTLQMNLKIQECIQLEFYHVCIYKTILMYQIELHN